VPQAEALVLGASPRTAHASSRIAVERTGARGIAMLEAFDLEPVANCLKQSNMDAVQYCMDNLSGQVQPWFQVKADGSLAFSQSAINGFIGGSVGVVGTVVSTLIKKGEVKDRLKCLYCNGSGQIVCGHCLGTGTVKLSATESVACSNCEGTGTVVCINCQGSGLSVPDEFLQVLGDEEVGFTEEDYIGLFDETPIPKKQKPPSEGGAAPPAPPTESSAATLDAPIGSRAEDYSDSGSLG